MIKKVITINEQHTTFIRDIEAGRPNIVGIAGTINEGMYCGKLEISGSGIGCSLQIKSEISEDFSQTMLDTIIDMISIKQQ